MKLRGKKRPAVVVQSDAYAAAVSTLRQPPDPTRLMMDSTGTVLLVHHAFPPLLAMVGPAATLLVKYNLDRQPDASPLG